MTRIEFLGYALSFVLAVLLIAAALRVLRWLVAVLPRGATQRAAAARWLPAMQLAAAIAIATAVVLFTMGPRATAAAAAAAGAVLLLAGWFVIRDVVAGIVLRAEQPFEPNQSLRLHDMRGTIRHVGARSLEIESEDGRRVRIAYGRLAAATVDVSRPRDITGTLRFLITLPAVGTVDQQMADIRAAALHSFYASARHEPGIRLAKQTERGRSFDVTVRAADPSHLPSLQVAVAHQLGFAPVGDSLISD